MTLVQLVTDLATSQRLRDAGFPQDTALRWSMQYEPHIPDVEPMWIPVAFNEPILCAAPTAGELEEWLIEKGTIEYIMSSESEVGILYSPDKRVNNCRNVRAHTLVSALAALVLAVAG